MMVPELLLELLAWQRVYLFHDKPNRFVWFANRIAPPTPASKQAFLHSTLKRIARIIHTLIYRVWRISNSK